MYQTDEMNSGVSLLSTVIGLLLSSILLYAFSAIIQFGLRGNNTIANAVDYNGLRLSIENILRNPAACGQSFKTLSGAPLPLPPTDPFEISIGGARLAYVGKILGNQAVISRLDLSIVSGPSPLASGNSLYGALLHLAVDRGQNSFGSRTLSNIDNPLFVNLETDAGGTLTSCYSNTPPAVTPPSAMRAGYFSGGQSVNFGTTWTGIQFTASAGGAGMTDALIFKTDTGEPRIACRGVSLNIIGPQAITFWDFPSTTNNPIPVSGTYSHLGFWCSTQGKIENGNLWIRFLTRTTYLAF